jgi:uncharacterized protein
MPRIVFLVIGHASIALGAIGIVLPLLPTTPFVILAAWAYARSSPRLAARLYGHPRFGPALRDWRDHRAVATRAKVLAIGAMVVSYALTVTLTASTLVPVILLLVMVPVGGFLLTRPSRPAQARR